MYISNYPHKVLSKREAELAPPFRIVFYWPCLPNLQICRTNHITVMRIHLKQTIQGGGAGGGGEGEGGGTIQNASKPGSGAMIN